MFKITYTDRFKKHYKKLHPNEKKQIRRKVGLLSEDPMHPSLRAKRIQGVDDLFECSVNMGIRIIWYYEGNQTIALLDVGQHDILNRFR
ncbi:MAG TPA: cytotoxin [Limnochordia bacterium]|nr:cytotoxin [Limnochordia bacterium]